MQKSLHQRIKNFKAYQIEGKQIAHEQLEQHVCQSCGYEFKGNYCPNCGEDANVKRITMKNVFSQVVINVARLDSALTHTLVDIFVRPGYMILEFIEGRRKLYVPPVKLFFLLFFLLGVIKYFVPDPVIPDNSLSQEMHSLEHSIYALLASIFSTGTADYLRLAYQWFDSQPYSADLFSLPFELAVFMLVFRKSKFRGSEHTPNWAEAMVVLFYVLSLYAIIEIATYPLRNTDWPTSSSLSMR